MDAHEQSAYLKSAVKIKVSEENKIFVQIATLELKSTMDVSISCGRSGYMEQEMKIKSSLPSGST